MSILIALILFSLIILFHELGHFIFAKLNHITVVEFSLGFGPRVLSKKGKETRYSIKALPFGGSCMMLGEGMEDETEGAFETKSALARISVIAAGPIFNFILAWIAASVLTAMIGYDPATVASVVDGYPAQTAGVMAGDTVVSMNGKAIFLGREITSYISLHQGETIELVVKRDKEKLHMTITPQVDEDGRYIMGVGVGGAYVKGNLLQDCLYGAAQVRYWIDISIESLKMLFRGQVGVQDMSGPVGVVNMIGDTYTEAVQYGWYDVVLNMLNIAILLSANLGVMNLLPIPALDGGRLFFLLIELIRGKRIAPEKEGLVHMAGLIALLALMIVVMVSDIIKIA